MKKLRLFTPGPTMVPEDVMLEMAQPMLHHRTAWYREMGKEVHELLQYLFQTKAMCLTFTGSGTSAMEGAIVGCCPPGHKALVILGRIAEVYPHMDYAVQGSYGMEFSPGYDGRIENQIQILKNDTEVSCRVTDNGPGFSEEALQGLFKLFAPGEPHINDNVGLDLALVKMIMDAHEGRIEIKNNTEGGATVKLLFTNWESL